MVDATATCPTCIRPVDAGYVRLLGGKIQEMCCDKVHGPHLVRPSAAASRFTMFWKSMKKGGK